MKLRRLALVVAVAAMLITSVGVPRSVAGSSTVKIDPGSFAFGNVAVGSKSQHAFTLTNYGKTSITISRVSASGPGFSESGLRMPLTLAAGRSIDFTAHFAPTEIGQVKGHITIESNALDRTVTIALSGTGVRQLTVNPAITFFGAVAVSSKSQHAFTLTNYGKTSITISRVSASGPGFSESGHTMPLTLAAGRSIDFTAHFAPT